MHPRPGERPGDLRSVEFLAVIPSLRAEPDQLRRLCASLSAAGADPVVVPTGRKLDDALSGSGLTVLQIRSNPGFGQTITRAAESFDWRWLLIVNDDIVIENSKMLLATLEEITAGGPEELLLAYLDPAPALGIPRALDVLLSVSLLGPLTKRLAPRSQDDHSPVGTDPASRFRPFSCALVSRALWLELGGFDEGMKYTFEDADFARRAYAAGSDIHFVDSSGLTHAVSSTSRRHMDRVLPVHVWSARRYLVKWGGLHPVLASTSCIGALLVRMIVFPASGLDRRQHLRGILRSISSLIRNSEPALPDYWRS